MPEANKDVPRPLRGRLPLIPAILIFVGIVVVAAFAWSHLFVKGPAPQADATPAEVATGRTEPHRGPYNLDDYVEPKQK
ncbi:MAG: hypothetical protein ACK41C_09365 [Phenylobacterium sp.]|jgi:hypothetical protein|uniref:hypothetical protein n=1 Tax=Phenylobacterium sp. TaxID=1871053 RepID=UPI00391A1C4C